jgi:hypothetical protein
MMGNMMPSERRPVVLQRPIMSFVLGCKPRPEEPRRGGRGDFGGKDKELRVEIG